MNLQNYDGVKELATLIVRQMVHDYHVALYKLKHDLYIKTKDRLDAIRAVHDYEAFFLSDRFKLYCDVEGKKIIRVIRERVENEENI